MKKDNRPFFPKQVIYRIKGINNLKKVVWGLTNWRLRYGVTPDNFVPKKVGYSLSFSAYIVEWVSPMVFVIWKYKLISAKNRNKYRFPN